MSVIENTLGVYCISSVIEIKTLDKVDLTWTIGIIPKMKVKVFTETP